MSDYRQEESSGNDAIRIGSPIRLYALSAIGCFIVAGVVWAIAQPEERTGPPVAQSPAGTPAPGGVPHDHDQGAISAKITELRQAVGEGKASADDFLLLANLLYDQGSRDGTIEPFAEAAVLYEMYLAEHPDNPDARTDYAFALYRTGRVDQAVDELLSIQRTHPDHQNSAFNLAIMYKEKDQPDSVLYYMQVTADIDSTTSTGESALEVLRAYSGAH